MTSYKLPGITLSIQATSPRVEKALKSIFNECQETHQEADMILRGNGIQNHEIIDYLPDWIIKRLPHLDVRMDPIMLYSPENQAAAIGKIGDSLYCAWNSIAGTSVNFVCTIDNQNSSYGLFHPVLIPVLREAFLMRGLLMLHSAGVSCPNGVGALIIAISGGGKTTTALSMVRIDAKLIADDLIVLNPLTTSLQAEGIPKLLNLKMETIGFFEELKALPNSSFTKKHRYKKSVSAIKVYGNNCMKSLANIHVVYFVKVSPDGPAVTRLTVADSLNRLALAHSFSRNQRLDSRSISGLTEALSLVEAYELTTGPNPDRLGKWLMQHCCNHKI